ncbi:MAG: RagB/SusD family nutrient uptake outer membrane protein [Weeksellaceae bacterium]
MKNIKFILLFLMSGMLINYSCLDDLDVEVTDPDELIGNNAYQSLADYTSGIAKVYAGLALSGQQGPAGAGDIGGIDEGFGQYLRAYWQLQQLPTDETKIAWNDGTLQTFNFQNWSSSSEFINAGYSRFLYEVELANQFLRDSGEDRLNAIGMSEQDKAIVQQYRAEARWLRALGYYHALDLFGNVPFKTEADPVGGFFPQQATKAELFNFIESELLAIETEMLESRQAPYGRADRASAWALLAKLYLNAEVYIQQAKYNEVITYCEKIMNGGYSLASNYENLFRADNHVGDARNEIIFAIPYDAAHMQTYGGTTFIINASVGGNASPSELGIPGGGWGGTRTTKNLVYLFAPDGNVNDVSDDRGKVYGGGNGIFFTDGQELEIADITQYNNGYGVFKFKNLNADGSPGVTGQNDASQVSVDFPLFRLGDVYLMWTEAKLRTGGADATYVNMLRTRAHAAPVTASQIDDQFILDERGRELYWEATRRTDLIRFGKFTGGSYVWPWKGQSPQGTATDAKFDLYPLPVSDLAANPNLTQNPGY